MDVARCDSPVPPKDVDTCKYRRSFHAVIGESGARGVTSDVFSAAFPQLPSIDGTTKAYLRFHVYGTGGCAPDTPCTGTIQQISLIPDGTLTSSNAIGQALVSLVSTSRDVLDAAALLRTNGILDGLAADDTHSAWRDGEQYRPAPLSHTELLRVQANRLSVQLTFAATYNPEQTRAGDTFNPMMLDYRMSGPAVKALYLTWLGAIVYESDLDYQSYRCMLQTYKPPSQNQNPTSNGKPAIIENAVTASEQLALDQLHNVPLYGLTVDTIKPGLRAVVVTHTHAPAPRTPDMALLRIHQKHLQYILYSCVARLVRWRGTSCDTSDSDSVKLDGLQLEARYFVLTVDPLESRRSLQDVPHIILTKTRTDLAKVSLAAACARADTLVWSGQTLASDLSTLQLGSDSTDPPTGADPSSGEHHEHSSGSNDGSHGQPIRAGDFCDIAARVSNVTKAINNLRASLAESMPQVTSLKIYGNDMEIVLDNDEQNSTLLIAYDNGSNDGIGYTAQQLYIYAPLSSRIRLGVPIEGAPLHPPLRRTYTWVESTDNAENVENAGPAEHVRRQWGGTKTTGLLVIQSPYSHSHALSAYFSSSNSKRCKWMLDLIREFPYIPVLTAPLSGSADDAGASFKSEAYTANRSTGSVRRLSAEHIARYLLLDTGWTSNTGSSLPQDEVNRQERDIVKSICQRDPLLSVHPMCDCASTAADGAIVGAVAQPMRVQNRGNRVNSGVEDMDFCMPGCNEPGRLVPLFHPCPPENVLVCHTGTTGIQAAVARRIEVATTATLMCDGSAPLQVRGLNTPEIMLIAITGLGLGVAVLVWGMRGRRTHKRAPQ